MGSESVTAEISLLLIEKLTVILCAGLILVLAGKYMLKKRTKISCLLVVGIIMCIPNLVLEDMSILTPGSSFGEHFPEVKPIISVIPDWIISMLSQLLLYEGYLSLAYNFGSFVVMFCLYWGIRSIQRQKKVF